MTLSRLEFSLGHTELNKVLSGFFNPRQWLFSSRLQVFWRADDFDEISDAADIYFSRSYLQEFNSNAIEQP